MSRYACCKHCEHHQPLKYLRGHTEPCGPSADLILWLARYGPATLQPLGVVACVSVPFEEAPDA